MNSGCETNMRKLSIIYDGGCLWTKKNAGGVHIFEVLQNLATSHEAILFAPEEKGCIFENHKFEVRYIPTVGRGIMRFMIYELLLFLYLFNYFIKSKPDVIYARSNTGIASSIISPLFNVPRVAEVNGLSIKEAKMRSEPAIRIFVMRKIIEKLNYKHAKKIVAVTKSLKEEIKKVYHIPDEKIVVIENGANTDLFKPMDKKECIKELNLDESYQYVCFVGKMAPWQGVEYLIEAVPLILKEVPNTKFLIVGGGMMKEKLIRMIKKLSLEDKFIFTGAVPYEEVPKYINASDICTAPLTKGRMKSGSSALKIYEYMGCEKPIVSSRITNLEFIEQQNAGILVEPENPEELAKAIIKLLRDKKLSENMGKNGRGYVVKNHSWKMVTKKVESVINEVLEK